MVGNFRSLYLLFCRISIYGKVCIPVAYVLLQSSPSSFLKGFASPHISHNLIAFRECNIFKLISSPPSVSVQRPLEHRNRVRGIRRPRLRHVPMLNKTRPIHPINVCQRNGFLARRIDTDVDEADIVVEAVAQDHGRNKRDDCKSGEPRNQHCPPQTVRSASDTYISTQQTLSCKNEARKKERKKNPSDILFANRSSFGIRPWRSKGSCSVRLRAMYLLKAPMASFST